MTTRSRALGLALAAATTVVLWQFTAGRYVLYPGTERYSDWGFPNLRRRSWSIAAHIQSPPGGGSGAIVNFGSIWGGAGGKGHVAYATAKGAVHNLTRSLALDHAREGIRVNAVCPGEVDTPMLRGAGRAVPLTDEQLADMADRVVPNGRLAQPDEIGRVVVFLCSDAASYMTGALVPVDGGWSAG